MKFSTELPETGFLRLPAVLKLIPVSKSTWWDGVRNGRFPKPVKLGQRMTAWKAENIRELIERLPRDLDQTAKHSKTRQAQTKPNAS